MGNKEEVEMGAFMVVAESDWGTALPKVDLRNGQNLTIKSYRSAS